MAGTSKRSTVVAIRLDNDVLDTLKRRAKQSGHGVPSYLRERIAYDTRRKHGRRRH